MIPPALEAAMASLLGRRFALVCPVMDVGARAWTAVYAVVSAPWSAEDVFGVEEDSLAVAAVLT